MSLTHWPKESLTMSMKGTWLQPRPSGMYNRLVHVQAPVPTPASTLNHRGTRIHTHTHSHSHCSSSTSSNFPSLTMFMMVCMHMPFMTVTVTDSLSHTHSKVLTMAASIHLATFILCLRSVLSFTLHVPHSNHRTHDHTHHLCPIDPLNKALMSYHLK